MAIDPPAIKIVRTTPPNLGGGAADVQERLTVKPVAPGVWDESLQLQISHATRRSYAAGLRDFFRREFQVSVSPETILAFLNLSGWEAIAKTLGFISRERVESIGNRSIWRMRRWRRSLIGWRVWARVRVWLYLFLVGIPG
jgi:hypothetical protein